MRARHTQARLQYPAITSKALVNRTRMKVVKMKLTKFFVRHSGMRFSVGNLPTEKAQARNPYSRWWLWIPGSFAQRQN